MIQTARIKSVWFLIPLVTIVTLLGWTSATQAATPLLQEESEQDLGLRPAYPVLIPLPVTLKVANEVKQHLTQVLGKAPQIVNPDERAVVVLQFDTARGSTGAGSDYNACNALAELLTSLEYKRVETVAYIPASRVTAETDDDADPKTRLVGHAVLVALACGEIALDESAWFGDADIDEADVIPPMISNYEYVAGLRSPLQPPIAMCLIDPSRSLIRATMSTEKGDKTEFVNQAELDRLYADPSITVNEENGLSTVGETALFSASDLEAFSPNCHIANTKLALAHRYGLDPEMLQSDPTRGMIPKAVQFDLPSFIDQKTVDWSLRAMDGQLVGDTNLIIMNMDCEGGDVQACLQLSRYLSALNPDKIRTVAYVPGTVKGPAALIALACDNLVMSKTSRIGGIYSPLVSDDVLNDIKPTIEDLAAEKGKPWSPFISVLRPNIDLARWANTVKRKRRLPKLMSKAEHERQPDADEWVMQDVQPMIEGLSGQTADRLFVATKLVDDFDQLRTYYGIDEAPRTLTPTQTDKAIEGFARFLASPFVSGWLLFGAMFLISTEMSSPGLSIPGFLGVLCLILFFWSQHLDGNAHWLEILLFVAGAIFILMEIFVIPGMGIFGIGGLLMVVTSIVLASQTFIIPRNSEELARLPVSLTMVAAAAGGFMVAAAVLRQVLPNSPYFKKMMLEPPVRDELDPVDREHIIDLSSLQGRSGIAITPLRPTGKARIAGQVVDVLTDGRNVDKGQPVVVTEALGNRVVVAPQNSEPIE